MNDLNKNKYTLFSRILLLATFSLFLVAITYAAYPATSVDTVTIVSPSANNSNVSSTSITVNFTNVTAGIGNCSILIGNATADLTYYGNSNETMIANLSSGFVINASLVEDTLQVIKATCSNTTHIDTYEVNSSEVYITYDTTTPTVVITFSPSTGIVLGYEVTVTCSAIDSNWIKNISLSGPGTWGQGCTPVTNSTSGSCSKVYTVETTGTKEFTCTAFDWSEVIGSATATSFSVSTTGGGGGGGASGDLTFWDVLDTVDDYYSGTINFWSLLDKLDEYYA